MWIDRTITPVLRRMAGIFPVVLVSGPRQAGKTALLQRTFPETKYVSLDDPSAADAARSAPAHFLSQRGTPLIIDEIQYVPSLFRHLKIVIDQSRVPGAFLLTGSQVFHLMQGVSESLAGRCGVLSLHTLSVPEIVSALPETRLVTCLHRGGYPALYAEPEIPVSLWYPSYVATYVERDVRNMMNVQDLGSFNRFIRACALRTGQVLNYSDLARDVAIAPNTARQWISLLTASGIVALTESHHSNLGKRLTKSPKLHFTDAGLACHLAGILNEEMLLASPLFGAFWETFAVGQICRTVAGMGLHAPVWYWRTPSGQEVDAVIELGTDLVAIECKAGEHPSLDDARGIQALRRFCGSSKVRHAYVVCRTSADYVLGDGTEVVGVGSFVTRLQDILREVPHC